MGQPGEVLLTHKVILVVESFSLPFKDRFPTELEFDIDRSRLLRYWRLQGIFGCGAAALPFSLLFGIAFGKVHVEASQDTGLAPVVMWLVLYIVAALLAGLLVATIIYVAICHLPSSRRAANLRLLVEGPYLRIVSGGYFVTDRRIHFRAISDFSTHEGPLLKMLGMKTLSFHVVGLSHSPSEQVTGLISPDDVRDQLCEIDASREHTSRIP